MPKRFGIKVVFVTLLLGLALPVFTLADSYGQQVKFYVDKKFDKSSREQISATLRYVSPKAYFYIDDNWWDSLSSQDQQKTDSNLALLAQAFNDTIYPKLTSIYGTEWSPGIDKDYHITILFEQMKKRAGGYFNSKDEYSKIEVPFSNQREMIYLNTKYLNNPIEKSYIAHEFTHLITFNQKDKHYDVDEEVWLNEARADYSPTLVGYDDKDYQNSNLRRRVKEFLTNPSDPLCEWKNQAADYGVANVFIHYLVDNYGIGVLADSLHSRKTGIASIEYALQKNGVNKTFQDVFKDWLITLTLNDCSFGKHYCYKDKNLANLRVTPSLVYLPSTQSTNLSLTYSIKGWSGHWYKIIGGNQGLEIKFKGLDNVNFSVPYVVEQAGQPKLIKSLQLNQNNEAQITLPNFAKDNTSIILMPFAWNKKSHFSSDESFYHFNLSVSTVKQVKQTKPAKSMQQMTVQELKAKILELQQKIAQLQAEIARLLGAQSSVSCSQITKNLYYGLTNNEQVKCLQEFLKEQGPDIYPQGLVTGNFLGLTKQAVIRFQEKYASQILTPLGLTHGTGFVGSLTRKEINLLLKSL